METALRDASLTEIPRVTMHSIEGVMRNVLACIRKRCSDESPIADWLLEFPLLIGLVVRFKNCRYVLEFFHVYCRISCFGCDELFEACHCQQLRLFSALVIYCKRQIVS